jgi:hypothetical protein
MSPSRLERLTSYRSFAAQPGDNRRGPLVRRRVVGGAEEIRTPDPLRAKEVLSQLSYGPAGLPARVLPGLVLTVVGHGGLEPPTSVLSGPRSNQLS